MKKKLTFTILAAALLCQCSQLQSDCEALRQREAEIAQEAKGDYEVPYTRFWGYLREPGQSWRTAKLVLMDERLCRTPDRGPEPPLPNAVYGTDNNVEYIVKGSYTGTDAYDPSTNQVLPLFRPTSFEVRNKQPGFLFVPSEKYEETRVSLRPALMPTPQQCAQYR